MHHAVLHTRLGSALPRGVPCPWWPAEVTAAVWGAAWQLPWSLQPCAPLQPPPATAAHRFMTDVQTSTHIVSSSCPSRQSRVRAHGPPSCPCGIVSAHEQQLQPASVAHCRPSPRGAPPQQLCRRTAIRQACTVPHVADPTKRAMCEPHTSQPHKLMLPVDVGAHQSASLPSPCGQLLPAAPAVPGGRLPAPWCAAQVTAQQSAPWCGCGAGPAGQPQAAPRSCNQGCSPGQCCRVQAVRRPHLTLPQQPAGTPGSNCMNLCSPGPWVTKHATSAHAKQLLGRLCVPEECALLQCCCERQALGPHRSLCGSGCCGRPPTSLPARADQSDMQSDRLRPIEASLANLSVSFGCSCPDSAAHAGWCCRAGRHVSVSSSSVCVASSGQNSREDHNPWDHLGVQCYAKPQGLLDNMSSPDLHSDDIKEMPL